MFEKKDDKYDWNTLLIASHNKDVIMLEKVLYLPKDYLEMIIKIYLRKKIKQIEA